MIIKDFLVIFPFSHFDRKIEGADYYFPMLKGDEVRFKVLETKFNRYNIVNQEKAVEPIITYATCKQELLGPVSWWTT